MSNEEIAYYLKLRDSILGEGGEDISLEELKQQFPYSGESLFDRFFRYALIAASIILVLAICGLVVKSCATPACETFNFDCTRNR